MWYVWHTHTHSANKHTETDRQRHTDTHTHVECKQTQSKVVNKHIKWATYICQKIQAKQNI